MKVTHENMKKEASLEANQSDTFIFRYDPESSVDRLFADFWDAVDEKIQSVEPHIVRSNSIEALTTNLNKSRLELFTILVDKQPNSLTEIARLLQKDYALVWRNARILEGMGLIKLVKNPRGNFHEIQLIPLYQRIIFDFPSRQITPKSKVLSTSLPVIS